MYRAGTVPNDARQLPEFLDQELRNIERGVREPVFTMQLSVLHKEPARLQDGLIVLADGTDWNPGSGAGFYGYSAGAWRFLG